MVCVYFQLSSAIDLDPRPEYHRCVLTWGSSSALPVAESTGQQGSSRLLSLRSANALMLLPPASDERSTLSAGEEVDAMLLRIM